MTVFLLLKLKCNQLVDTMPHTDETKLKETLNALSNFEDKNKVKKKIIKIEITVTDPKQLEGL